MKLSLPLTALTAFLLGVFTVACAQESELDRVKAKVAEFLPQVNKDDVRPSSVPGLYEVQQGYLFGYITGDGKYLIQGDMVNLETGEEVTEGRRKSDRLARIEALGTQNMIEFGPADPAAAKYDVTVFTDIDCGYCRKLHREMEDYNAAGIRIRYIFYPRSGPQTDSFKKAEAVWCSSDRKLALTKAKQGAPLVGDPQCENPVQKEWELGQALGLRGTPLIVLPDGEAVNGYVPAAALAARLAEIMPDGQKGETFLQ